VGGRCSAVSRRGSSGIGRSTPAAFVTRGCTTSVGCGIVIVIFVVVVLDGGARGGTTYGETTGKVAGGGRARHTHGTGGTADRGTDRHGRREGAMWSVETSLDEIFAFWLGYEGLELCGSKSINETCLRDDEQQDLGTSKGGEFVSLREESEG
jgi:hypothetical protein